MHRKVIILGATGSIGVNTLEVIQHLNAIANETGETYQVVGLAANRNAEVLIQQAIAFGVKHLAVADEEAAAKVSQALPDVTVHRGPQAAHQLVASLEATDLVAAIVGSAGLPATLAGIEKGMRISLANKETLVAAGELVTPLVAMHNTALLPVDSEHSAIFQCLQGATRTNEEPTATQAQATGPYPTVKRIVLTASGGPFRTKSLADLQAVTVEQALNHPTWDMGPKITIDSSTLMNKALEVIEAHWLFDLPSSQIEVLVHPQSIVHSFVEFRDNSVLAQLGPPDMKTPIQYALTWPDRPAGCSETLDWTTLSQLTFEPPDHERFGALKLAYQVIDAGGTAGAIFNAANEAAVEAFLNKKISYLAITDLVKATLDRIDIQPITCLDDVMHADQLARQTVEQLMSQTQASITPTQPSPTTQTI